MLNFKIIRSLNIFLIACLALSGCATMQIPDYASLPVQSYSNRITKDGLSIAVRPINDKKEMKKYFGINLASAKILAIFIKAENTNQNTSYLLAKDKIKVGQGATMLDDEIAYDSKGDGIATIGFIALGIIPIAALPAIFTGLKMASNSSAVQHNFAVKELRTRTISPGKSVEGFIYFQIPDTLDESQELEVHIEAVKLQTKDKVNFVFPINIKKGG